MLHEDLYEDLYEEWDRHQRTCNCISMRMPPCSFCESGYNMPFDEWLECVKSADKPIKKDSWESVNDKYDRAMKGLFY